MLSTMKLWQRGAVTFLYEKWLLVKKQHIFYSFLSSSGNKRLIKEHFRVSLFIMKMIITLLISELGKRKEKSSNFSSPTCLAVGHTL